MPKVHPAQPTDRATNPEPSVQDERVRLVTDLEAEPVFDSGVVLLRLKDPYRDDCFVFALSLPAGKQLAEALEKAVDDCLHATPAEGFDVSQFVWSPDTGSR